MLKKLIRNKEFFSKKNIEPVPKDAPLLFEIYEKDKKIERLNNIIDELEKYIEEKNSFYKISTMGYSYGVTKDILDKLKELKEGK